MKLEDAKNIVSPKARPALEKIWESLEFAEGFFGPTGIDYIQMMTVLQTELATRIFNATSQVRDKK